ncbi:amino acid permease [Paenibacillus sp. PL2-23]|uniref:amino acid permease n=1 Tax=Paenibacillus sp. PL2-23 TaxID=2100729 RepID=UPI0030F78B38
MATVLLGMALGGTVCMLMLALAIKAQRSVRLNSYQSLASYGRQMQLLQDKHDLARFGLSQLLGRGGGGIWPMGLSFGTMALLGSSVIVLGPALQQGGLSVIGYGLPLLGLFYVCVSGSLAELSSAYPVAGSFYYAAKEMGGRRWGLRAGWFHAGGHLAMLALLIGGCAYAADSSAAALWGYQTSGLTFGLFALAIAATQAAVHQYGAAWLKSIHAAGLWLQLAGALLLLAGLAWLFWPGGYSPALLYQLQTIDFSGKVGMESYLVGLLWLTKLFIGMDGASQAAEEAMEPRVKVPWAIFLATSYAFVIGFALLTLVAIMAGPSGVIGAAGSALGWSSGSTGMLSNIEVMMAGLWGSPVVLFIILVSLWGSGLQSLSVCARTLLGLARENAAPFASKLGLISGNGKSPWAAGWIGAATAAALLAGAHMASPGSALLPLLAFAIVALHTAYAIPIGLRFTSWGPFRRARLQRAGEESLVQSRWSSAPWQLGGWSPLVNGAAFLWLVVTSAAAVLLLEHAAAIGLAVLMLLATVFELVSRRQSRPAPRGK